MYKQLKVLLALLNLSKILTFLDIWGFGTISHLFPTSSIEIVNVPNLKTLSNPNSTSNWNNRALSLAGMSLQRVRHSPLSLAMATGPTGTALFLPPTGLSTWTRTTNGPSSDSLPERDSGF